MSLVVFVDTSVLVNILRVPYLDQDRDSILEEFKQRREERQRFLLPITTVIETGNHIAQVKDGHGRAEAAERFKNLLELVRDGRAPFLLNDVDWNSTFLDVFLRGADTGSDYVQHARNKVGAGDLCILIERQQFLAKDTGSIQAEIWTLDRELGAYG